ncbi:hypothetical protein BASA81_004751 [Batrachochytrium salamandrivorans]|nr:hypothetical protein BASA81_004751 [Batrachochytrium salamandrivorans]
MSKRFKLAPKRVSFAADCKEFDGLSDRSVLLEHVVHRLLYRKLAVNELYVMQLVDSDFKRAWGLLQDLADLVWRMGLGLGMDESPKRSFLLLERGGGANLRLVREHFPFVLLLGRVVEAAFHRLSPSTEATPFQLPQPSAPPAVVT